MYNSISKPPQRVGYVYWDVDDEIPAFDSIYCYKCDLEDETESKATILFIVPSDNDVHIQGSCDKHGTRIISRLESDMVEQYVAKSQKEMEVMLHNFAMEHLMRS